MSYTKSSLESAIFRFIPTYKNLYNTGDAPLPTLLQYACVEIIDQRQSHTDHDVEIIRSANRDLKNLGKLNFKS